MNRPCNPALMAGVAMFCAAGVCRADALPFRQSIEVFREKDTDVAAFVIRLEQPFLAEEFEKSNYLRLAASDRNAFLIYPKETKFQQKHAEFFGRLRGQGTAKLQLSYEIVSENPDGTRKIEVRKSDISVTIPKEPVGSVEIHREWARRQNDHFLELLRHYPDETFFQYCLLQSGRRYGIHPPEIPQSIFARRDAHAELYDVFTGSLAVQESLQLQSLRTGPSTGDLSRHIASLTPPHLQSLPYERLLEEKLKKGVKPTLHEAAKLVPHDCYFLHFHSVEAAGEMLDLSTEWGDSLLRLLRVRAEDNRVLAKFEEQLCIRRGVLTKLFGDKVVSEIALVGSDPFVLEGSDVTLLIRLKAPDVFDAAAAAWLADARKRHPGMVEQEFNYKGHKIAARYTDDRLVASFTARHGEFAVVSNSHRAIRNVVDAAVGAAPRLYDALDYRYVTTLLPPADGPRDGWLFASEAFLKRMVGPGLKISEKRRLECFNNLVMLNNASLFHRLEKGRAPAGLAELAAERFVDTTKIVCPHGGAYGYDAAHDTATCSLHNRIKHLTPNVELNVLRVSHQEAEGYERYRQQYREFWQGVFDPVAVRITVAPRLKLEVCVLPLANGSLYTDIRSRLAGKPLPLSTHDIASSAVASISAVPGRQANADLLRAFPGAERVLEADPTLTDLSWVGERFGFHFCDDDTILEIDPLRLSAVELPMLGRTEVWKQVLAGAALSTTQFPTYLTIDVEDRAKAERFLDRLVSRAFLERGELAGQEAEMDAYRLPDYKGHAIHVIGCRFYALKVRLHVALVGNRLVAATKPTALRQVIDAASAPAQPERPAAHLQLRLNRKAVDRLHDNLRTYWSEKSRLACHRNTISIQNLIKLYEVPVGEVPRLAEAAYGVRWFCPEHGTYHLDTEREQVVCGVHGNRQRSRLNPIDGQSSFDRFFDGIDEIVASLRFENDGLIATVEIARRPAKP